MAVFATNEIRSGMKVLIDQDPCIIVDNIFVKPGKGQAFNRIKFKNLKTGRVVERTWKSGDTLEAADVLEIETQYLYSDGSGWHFMCESTYEQFVVNATAIGDTKKWLKEQTSCTLTLWNSIPLSVAVPNFVVLKVTQTDPGLKGDTSGGGIKPATLETDAVIRVPLFIQEDELIKVDTRTGEYISRAKD